MLRKANRPINFEHHNARHARHRRIIHLSAKSTLAITLMVGWFFLLTLLAVGIAWVVLIQLGINPWQTTITNAQIAQVSFWVTIWSLLAIYGLSKIIRHQRRMFFRYSRRILLLAMPISLTIGSITTAGFSAAAFHKPNSPEACSIQETLELALANTISIHTENSHGSGFIISQQGLVVTNYHVIKNAQSITTRQGTDIKIPLSIVQVSPEYDLALLKLDTFTSEPLNFTSIDADHPAEPVYAIGYPANYYSNGFATITSGVVSRKVIPAQSHNLPPDIQLFQTDAAINPGNSGGPIINKCGVIGVARAISATEPRNGIMPREEGIGFATSSETVQKVLGLE